MSKGFLSRWSRRKSSNSIEDVVQPRSDATNAKVVVKLEESANADVPQTPTMDDVEKIDKSATDFSAFMQGDVDPAVQRAAMKNLFSDPHFNVMDGLDIYIDDYSKPDPISQEILSQLVQSEMLGLFRNQEEVADVGGPKETREIDKQMSLGSIAESQKNTGEQVQLGVNNNLADQTDDFLMPSKTEKKM